MEPAEWRTHAAIRAGWRDEVTGEPLDHQWECHHVLPARLLRLHGLAHLVWHPANAMALNAATHHAHESAMRRIPASALKPHHVEFARLAEAAGQGDWATAYLQRTYPEENQ